MRHDDLAPVSRGALEDHVRQALRRYWPDKHALLEGLALTQRPFPAEVGALRLVMVPLPEWALAFGVDGCLAVPSEACADPARPQWRDVDWWLAAFLMLECWHERAWEARHGCIHSYSYRLAGWDQRVWSRAWVNRIALLLRSWAARSAGLDTDKAFGPLPRPEIVMTHDVDAVEKTWAIRLKQAAFIGFNAARLAAQGQVRAALARLAHAFRFFVGRCDWSMLEKVLDLEQRAGVRSRFNFYADDRPKNLRRWVFDPGYDVARQPLRSALGRLLSAGWSVGLHQSHDAWQSAALMQRQRERLQSVLGAPVITCRQHWLQFSWRDTWSAQTAAGFEQDTTLMFNDRPGLRAAAALAWNPWNPLEGRKHGVSILPTMLMDSHLYDYMPMNPSQRHAAFRHWLGEVAAVGGQVAVLWHPHTLSRDYGWADGFEDLVTQLSGVSRGAVS